jgi:hypothetical protein
MIEPILIDEDNHNKNIRLIISTVLLFIFLFIIENTAHIPLIVHGIFKHKHWLLVYTMFFVCYICFLK